VELDNEGVSDLLHDISLNLGVVYLVGADDEVFLERLDRVDLLRVLLARHVHFAEGAAPNHLQQLEVLDRELLVC